MKRTEFYLKLNINDFEFNALQLEKMLYESLKKEMGRGLSFPEEDLVITPIEFYQYEFKQHANGGKTLSRRVDHDTE